ncbi:FlgB family protein [uncultured Maritimibacter sp.]|jgi:flagellar basal-body rod protein FlgB|uniref:FlgB family protein n=1 Tax=uncultured Maritimibacter sp. TaxID=991866 RepID=UPI000A42E3E4|nr:FlgB family protein [uncultured Maritimibacter sp.]
MFDKLEIFRMAQGLALHSAARTAAIAENIANADTPGYRAHDLKSFADTFEVGGRPDMRATRNGHLGGGGATFDADEQRVDRPGAMSPSGNNVSLETEMMQSVQAKGAHDRALAIYKSALTIMRTSINGGR